MAKLRLATYWAAACGGCDVAILDTHEKILDIAAAADIVLWPLATDFKYADIEAMPDGHIDVTLFHGAVRNSENEHLAKLLRAKTKVLVAFGSCAHLGGIPGLANLYDRSQIFKRVYHETPSTVNPENNEPQTKTMVPEGELTIPEMYDTVRPLDKVVDVDYYLPGCPPTPQLLNQAMTRLLSGDLPSRGSVLAPDIALCDQCSRKDSKPVDLKFTEFKRPHLSRLDPQQCFLAQGLVCMGPATRGGCEAQCVQGNMPCSGCFGPTSRVRDQGAKILSSLCSNIAATTEPDIDRTLATIPDPVGTFYRYSLAGSLLRARVPENAKR